MEKMDWVYVLLYCIQMFFIIGLFFYQKNKLAFINTYLAIIDLNKIKINNQLFEDAVNKIKEANEEDYKIKVKKIEELTKTISSEEKKLLKDIKDIYEKSIENLIWKNFELAQTMVLVIDIIQTKENRDEFIKKHFPLNKDDIYLLLRDKDSNNS